MAAGSSAIPIKRAPPRRAIDAQKTALWPGVSCGAGVAAVSFLRGPAAGCGAAVVVPGASLGQALEPTAGRRCNDVLLDASRRAAFEFPM